MALLLSGCAPSAAGPRRCPEANGPHCFLFSPQDTGLGGEGETQLEQDRRLATHHRLHAVRAHLLEMTGDTEKARESYLLASRLTTSIPEQDHLRRKAEAL